MTEIVFDKRIPDPSEDVGIPEALRYKGLQHLQGCVRVTIEAESNGRWAKANGFKLSPGPDGYPTVEIDAVLCAIMQAVNAKFREREADHDMASQNFRIVFDRRVSTGRSRPTVDLRDYSPDGPEVPYPIDGDGHAVLHETIIHSMANLADKLAVRIDGMIEHVVTLSSQQKNMFEPLVQMMAIAHQNSILGLEQQRSAMQYMFSIQRVEVEEAAKDRRADKWMNWLKKPVNTAMNQFGKFMRAKAGFQVNDDDEEEDEEDEEAQSYSSPDEPSAGQPQHRTGASEGSSMEHPIAEFAKALGHLLEPAQWAEVSKILTAKQFQMFTDMFGCKTDEECVKAYDKLAEKIPPTKLVAMNAILDKRQRAGLDQLRKIIASGREGWKDGNE